MSGFFGGGVGDGMDEAARDMAVEYKWFPVRTVARHEGGDMTNG